MNKDISITPVFTAYVINDNVIQQHILAGLLCKEGFTVRTFASVESALSAMIPDAPPSLIVTDIYMPEINGWCFCRLLRSPDYASFNEIPILVVSATFSGDEAFRITTDVGANAFLPLPIDEKRFVDTVHTLLRGEQPLIHSHVLIAGENERQAGFLKKTFEAEGYLADTVLTVREAIQAFKETFYDVAVIDYHLPDGQGDELLATFRNDQPDCACIIMTAEPSLDLTLAWLRLGAAAYLHKPFEATYLIELCARARRERSLMRMEDLMEKKTRQLRESEKKYRELFEGVPAGLYQCTLGGGMITANQACLDLWRCRAADRDAWFSQDVWKTCVHPEDGERFWSLLLKQGYVKGFEASFYRCDGTIGWLSNTAKIVCHKPGQPMSVTGSFTDITERKYSEESLQKKQNELQLILDTVPALIFYKDTNNNIIRANNLWYKTLGLSRGAGEQISLFEFLPKNAADKFFHDDLEVLATGQPKRSILEYVKTVNGFRWFLTDKVPYLDPGGKIIGIICLSQDVTEHKEAEEALRVSEERHRTILQTAIDGFWLADMQGHLLEVNEAYCRMSGYSEQELLQMQISDFEATETTDDTIAHMQKVITEGEDRFESCHRCKDGSIFDVEISVQFRTIEGGRCVVFLRDITERKQAAKSLYESRSMLRYILDTIPQSVFWKDTKSVYLGCNTVFAKAAGIPSPSDIAGKTDFDLPWLQSDAEAYRADDADVIAKNTPKMHIFEEIQQADGTRIYADTTKLPLVDKQGTVYGILGVYEDITGQKLAEEENAKLEAQLNQVRKLESLGILAGGMAHDFNNILSVIYGYGDIAKMELSEDEPVYDAIANILAAADRAKELVQHILNFSRQTEESMYPIDLKQILKESIKMLRASLPTSIEISVKMDLNNAIINANPTHIQQVVINLVTNAFQAIGKEGVIEINLSSAMPETHSALEFCDIKSTAYAHLSVTDTGEGIPPEIINKIFDPYFTTKEKGRGTGLGLSIVHGIVKKNGGTITVTSVIGSGSTFHVYFPLAEQKNVITGPVKKELKRGTERILLVDDELTLAQLEKMMLENIGYLVTSITNPEEALELFSLHPDQYDLVLADMTMPKMTGDCLAREILDIRPDMPIIIVTGHNEQITPEIAESIGVRALLGKPLSLEVLSETLRAVFDQ